MAQSQTELQRKIFSDQVTNHPQDYFGRLIAPYLIRSMRKYIRFPLLDAGAGEGSMIREIIRKYPKQRRAIYGLDLVPFPDLNIQGGDLQKLPWQSDMFQTILCTEVLEHLENTILTNTLAELYRVLQPSGYLICTFPYDEDVQRQTFTCPHCGESFHKYGHVRSWHTPDSVRDMFTRARFRVEYFDILPLGAIAKMPPLKFLKILLNKLDNPPGFKKRALVVLRK